MFSFNRTAQLLAEGYRATHEALDRIPDGLDSLPPGGIHPVRHVEVRVDQEKCVGCGLCAAMNPRVFAMDEHGKAMVRMRERTTTPLGDVAVRICPTCAISVETVSSEP